MALNELMDTLEMAAMELIPKEPAYERGVLARQTYLELARRVIRDPQLEYDVLYQRFVENDWAAVQLDEAVALKGLIVGYSPKVVSGILHQSPYLQYHVHQNKVPLAPMSQYVRATVMKVFYRWRKNFRVHNRQKLRRLVWRLSKY